MADNCFALNVCLGLSPMAPPSEHFDGRHADIIQRIVQTLSRALSPRREHQDALNALARHIFDSSNQISSNSGSLSKFGERIDAALLHRLNNLRNSTRRSVSHELLSRSKARITAYAKSEAEKIQSKEISRALADTRRTNDLVLSIFEYMQRPKNAGSIPPLPETESRVDIVAESNKTADSKKSLQLLKEMVEDSSLDPDNLPRIVKNRLAAHYSITRRTALAKASRRELRKELLHLRSLAEYATAVTNSILNIRIDSKSDPRDSPNSPHASTSSVSKSSFTWNNLQMQQSTSKEESIMIPHNVKVIQESECCAIGRNVRIGDSPRAEFPHECNNRSHSVVQSKSSTPKEHEDPNSILSSLFRAPPSIREDEKLELPALFAIIGDGKNEESDIGRLKEHTPITPTEMGYFGKAPPAA